MTSNFQSQHFEFLRLLPKCEHHLHIEGTLEPSFVFELADKNKILLPNDPAYASVESLTERYANFQSLADFLDYYYFGLTLLKTVDDYEKLAWNYFVRVHGEGVVHVDLSFDAQAHSKNNVNITNVTRGFKKARERAEAELGITSELICCFLRHLPPDECLQFLESDEFKVNCIDTQMISGIGLDSNEKDFRPELFTKLFNRAKALGLRLTSHAGEEAGPHYIEEALDSLKVERIDHGLSLPRDSKLMQRVAQAQILVTCCPLSNIVLRNAKSIKDVPIRQFLVAGVRFSINSDDPAYFGGYILKNFEEVQTSFNLSIEEWEWITNGAVEGSWCSEQRKSEIRAMVEACFNQWRATLDT